MGGKSRKTGGISKKLIDRIKKGNKKNKSTPKPKPDNFPLFEGEE